MSLVDVRFPELDLFLQRWRARLNRRWLAGEALAAWVTAGALALPLAWFVPGGTAWWAALGTSAAGGFVLWKYPRRLSRYRAAAWLDERCQTQGLFGAAVECLQREDGETHVLEAAEAARPQAAPRLPWKKLALRTVLAAAVAGTGLLSFEAPSLLPFLALPHPERPSEAGPLASAPQTAPPREMNPGDVARKLFPENPRLAALAEQALTDGGEDALRALLQQAQDSQSLPGTGKSKSQPQRPRPDSDQPGDPRSGEDRPGDQPPPAGGRSTPQPGDPSAPGADLGRGQGKDKGQGKGSAPGEPDSGSGDDVGKGRSDKRLGQVDPGERRPPLVLKEPPAAGLFEFALPGSGPRLPSADALAAARRSAESQVTRVDPPLEFQSTIRDYFLSLTQEVSP